MKSTLPAIVAVGKILARGDAVLAVRSAVAAAGVDGVLIAQQAHIVKDGAVAGDQQRQSLRAGGKLRMGCVEIVLEGDVLGKEVVGGHIHGGGVERAAVLAGAAIIDDHCLARRRDWRCGW